MTFHVGQLRQKGRRHADVPEGCVDVWIRVVRVGLDSNLEEVIDLQIRSPPLLCRPLERLCWTRVVVQHDPTAVRTFDDVASTSPVRGARNREQCCAVGPRDGLGVQEHRVRSHCLQFRPIAGTSQHVSQGLGAVKNLLASQGLDHLRGTRLIEPRPALHWHRPTLRTCSDRKHGAALIGCSVPTRAMSWRSLVQPGRLSRC